MISRGFRLLFGLVLLPAVAPPDLPAAGSPVAHMAPSSPLLDDACRALLEDARDVVRGKEADVVVDQALVRQRQ